MRAVSVRGGEPVRKLRAGEQWSPIERALHARLIAQFTIAGQGPRQIMRIFAKGYAEAGLVPTRLTYNYVVALVRRTVRGWQADADKAAPIGAGKEGQLRRLFAHLNEAKSATKTVGSGKDKRVVSAVDWTSVVAIEREIAKLQGNYAPVKIQAEVVQTVALREVITNMTPEQLVEEYQAAVEEDRELQALRSAAPQLPPHDG